MKTPEPQAGLVIRDDVLWSHERERGFADGVKARSCLIETAILRRADGLTEVLLAPITHSPPGPGAAVIAIPPRVARHLGLDDERSCIIADESNSVAWDDAGIIPAEPGARWAYGRIPQALYEQLRARPAQQAEAEDGSPKLAAMALPAAGTKRRRALLIESRFFCLAIKRVCPRFKGCMRQQAG